MASVSTDHGTNQNSDESQSAPGRQVLEALTSNGATDEVREEEDAIQYRSRRQYIFSRPKVIQYTYQGRIVHSQVLGSSMDVQGIDESTRQSRERIDLFIDLIWVGIIGNIAEAHSSKAAAAQGGNVADAFVLYLVVFLPSWRIWNGVREILANYYRDDLLQRSFIFLLLVLSVYFGNNIAYTTEDPAIAEVTTVSIYLLIRATLVGCEVVYSIFIPWLRRIVLLTVLLYIPSIGLWVAAMYLDGTKAYGAIAAAIVVDYTVPIILDLRITRTTFFRDHGKALDAKHLITLGEGVLQLVRNGPLGIGFTWKDGCSVWALLVYFLLTQLYFNRDSSPRYVPAAIRKGYKTWLWMSFHIPIFLSVLSLSNSILLIVRGNPAELDEQSATGDDDREPQHAGEIKVLAVWTVAISLAVAVFAMTVLALLDEPRNIGPCMRVENRYLRLIGRPIHIVIVLCIPLGTDARSDIFLQISALLMGLLTAWEYVASTEAGHKVYESRKEQCSKP